MTFLFVEHDMDVVMTRADRVIVMAEGAVIADGPPDGDPRRPRVIDAYLAASRPSGAAMSDRCLLATDGLVAGYSAEVDILRGVSIAVARRARSSPSSGRTAPASRR